MIDLDDVRRAAARLDGVAHRTPVVTSRTLDARTGATVRLKPESFQRAGAFKFRGAYNTVAQLDAPRGVATASSGNHAQALALSAALHDLPATILMPEDAPASKAAATEGYGATIVRFDRYEADREALLAELAEREGLAIAHPYDDERMMAGNGTAALELVEDGGELDLLLAPVGGGGLIAGAATAATGLCPDCQVVGVEPEVSDDTARSLAAGERVSVPVSARSPTASSSIPPASARSRDPRARLRVVTVSDAEIVAAMRFAFERLSSCSSRAGHPRWRRCCTARWSPGGARA